MISDMISDDRQRSGDDRLFVCPIAHYIHATSYMQEKKKKKRKSMIRQVPRRRPLMARPMLARPMMARPVVLVAKGRNRNDAKAVLTAPLIRKLIQWSIR